MTKRLLLTALVLFAPWFAYADGGCANDVATRVQNNLLSPIAGASVLVCTNATCNVHATLYQDSTLGVTIANPVTADARGNYSFCALPGQYTVKVTNPADSSFYTVPQVTVPVALDGVLSVKSINGVRYADNYPGVDCGAKINAADADLGSGGGEIRVNQACGTTWSTAVTLRNSLRFIECGTYTTSAAITLSVSNAAISGPPSGQTTACVNLKQANGANLAALIIMAADQTILQDIFVDGNKANNVSAGTNIKVTAHRVEIFRVTTKDAKTHGLSFISTGTNNEAGSGKVFRLMANENGQSGVYGSGTADVFVGGGSELESNGAYGIELSDSPTWRIEHSDIGGNIGGGIYAHGTSAGAQANRQIIIGNQFGDNQGHDIHIVGYNAGDTAVGSNIMGNSFIGLGASATTNTYDCIKLVDGGYNAISGNAFQTAASPSHKYGIEITETAAGRSYPNIIGINAFGSVAFGSAKFSDTTSKSAAALVENLWSSSGNTEGAFGLQDTTSGAATPKKYFRVSGGNLQIINSAFGAVIVTVTDAGKGTFNGGLDANSIGIANAGPIGGVTTIAASGLSSLTGGFKAGASGSTISDTRELVQSVHDCGTTTTCANTTNLSEKMVRGTVALSSATPSTAVVTGMTAFGGNTAAFYSCWLTNETTQANPVKYVRTSSSSITITGPNTVTDVISYLCVGH